MDTAYALLLFFTTFVCVVLLADAIVGFIEAARGRDEDAVQRRLAVSSIGAGDAEAKVEIVRGTNEGQWQNRLPFQAELTRLAKRAGDEGKLGFVWLQIGIYSVFLFGVLAFFLSTAFLPALLILAPTLGVGLTVLSLKAKAKRRSSKFEEQLPDAIDLMVRSLRVGHPVSGAMAVIAREMPAPIGPEFAIAFEEVTYGQDVPGAFRSMAERVDVPDLSFLNVVLQVQQDSGGNLVETLSKLATVMRDRFRMFRKVKALTVEGRVSAWILSAFPLGIAVILRLVKPDYFDQVLELAIFPYIVAGLAFLLIVNLLAMRMITNIRV